MGHETLLKLMVFMVVASMVSTIAFGTTFRDDFKPTFGDNRVNMYGQDGKSLTLSLDKYSGSGFASKKEYLFGRFDIEMKFIAGDSAGSVTTFYLSSEENVSEGDAHDEIDFEFLGNASGQPYTIHTNVFGKGKGGREQQFQLWFDPTKDYHTYSIVWNPKRIIFLIDETPIRLFKNLEHMGVPYLRNQPMRIYSSLWNADQWATQGGAVKADWSKAPFTAYYRNPSIDACEGHNVASCVGTNAYTASTAAAHRRHREWRDHDLTPEERRRMRWAHMHHKVYDYCNDRKRYPNGFPPECKQNRV